MIEIDDVLDMLNQEVARFCCNPFLEVKDEYMIGRIRALNDLLVGAIVQSPEIMTVAQEKRWHDAADHARKHAEENNVEIYI